MTLHSQSLTPDWKTRLVVPRGVLWPIGIRLRESGAVVTPSAASVSLYRDTSASSLYVASGALTPGATTEYALTVASSEALSSDWIAVWAATVATVVYSWRQRVYLVGSPLAFRVDQEDLYGTEPDLRHPARLPAGQTTWTPQILAARDAITQRLTATGKRPWLAVDASDLYQLELAEALALACAAIPSQAGSHYAEAAARHRAEAARLELTLGVEYEDAPSVTRAVGPTMYPAAPVGRPAW